MRRTTLDRLKQVFFFTSYFCLVSLLLFFNDAFIRTAPDLQQVGPYHTYQNLFSYLAGGIFGGLMVAVFELFILGNLFKKYGLLVLGVGRGLFLVILYFIMSLVLSFGYNVVVSELPPYHEQVLSDVWQYMTGPVVLINLVFYAVFVMILIFFHQIIDLVGRGVLGKFLFGRYKIPRVVDRTFLFMDMNDSTSIAEKIGHVAFFELMQDFLVEAGAEIREHGGEINKYVGDEIIALWNVDQGARNGLALEALLAIGKRLERKSPYFQDKYGVVPDFKSGLHVGPAMVGELGDWKREVAFMGDSMNTTARIQGACKKLGARILMSEDYRDKLIDSSRYSMTMAGKGKLRGKEQPMTLYRVEPARVAIM